MAHTTTRRGILSPPMEHDLADGFPIPPEIRYLWDNITPITRMLHDLANIGVALRSAKETGDPQFKEVNFVNAIGSLKQLQAELDRAIPFAVCPACQGKLRNKCLLCRGRGAISKFLWESPAVTEGIRKVRKMRKK